MRFGDRQAVKELDAKLLWHVQEQALNLLFIANHVETIDNNEVEDSLRSIQKQIPYLETDEVRLVRPCHEPGCWRQPGSAGVRTN